MKAELIEGFGSGTTWAYGFSRIGVLKRAFKM
jgi:hypothetical protein